MVGAGTRPSPDPEAPVGNGRAIAVRAAREGASVICVDRDEGAAQATRRQITEEGGTAAVVVCDVTTEEGCATRWPEPGMSPDGIVLNVGTGFGVGVAGTSADDWDRTFALNLRSHFLLVRRALVVLPDAGSILFIGSVAGLVPGSRIPAYDASKAGIIGLEPPCRPGGRPPWHPGQRAGPGPDRHAARAAPPRPAGPRGRARRCRSAARARRGRWPRPRCSCSRTRRVTSPVRCWPSTAGSPWYGPNSAPPRPGPPSHGTPAPGQADGALQPGGDQQGVHPPGRDPAGLGIVIHVGRRTRTVYRTPVIVFRTKDGFRVALTYGRDSDWVDNALAHGAVRLVTRRKEYEQTDPEDSSPMGTRTCPPALPRRARPPGGCRTSWTCAAPCSGGLWFGFGAGLSGDDLHPQSPLVQLPAELDVDLRRERCVVSMRRRLRRARRRVVTHAAASWRRRRGPRRAPQCVEALVVGPPPWPCGSPWAHRRDA